LVIASDIWGTFAWIRVRTPRGGAAVVVTGLKIHLSSAMSC